MWIVPRMSASRTTRRSTIRSDSASRRERLESRPQPGVGGVRRLGLEADEVLDRRLDRHRRALEQELSRQRRAVERPRAAVSAAARLGAWRHGATAERRPDGNRSTVGGVGMTTATSLRHGGHRHAPTSHRHALRLLALATCSPCGSSSVPSASAGNPCFTTSACRPRPGPRPEIKLMPCAFAPTVTRSRSARTVTFFNGPTFAHLVTGANQAWGSRDVELQPGDTVSYTFDTAGVYPYACALHRGMSGVIVVGDVASAIGAGVIAAGPGGAGGARRPAARLPQPSEALLRVRPASLNPFLAIVAVVGALVGALVAGAVIWVTMRRRHRTGATPQAPLTPGGPI